MANTRELRRRIKSIKNTSQITKAMQMVAATKMRRAQNQALSGRPYSTTLNQAILRLLPHLETLTHPLLHENTAQTSAVLLLSTDKGLCGALNTNIFRAYLASHLGGVHTNFYTVGRKGRQFAIKMGKDLVADFENSDLVTFRTAVQIGKLVLDSFKNGEIKDFYVIYPNFVSTLRQEAKVLRLLPVDMESLKSFAMELTSRHPERSEGSLADASTSNNDFLFEPALSSLLDFVLVHFVETKIYQALLETKASEHSARMIAMQNATDNAKELVGDLTLSYNQTRQESITKELLEITSALAALE